MRYSTCKYTVTLKAGLGSLKVIENYAIQSRTPDFLLTFHSIVQPKATQRFTVLAWRRIQREMDIIVNQCGMPPITP